MICAEKAQNMGNWQYKLGFCGICSKRKGHNCMIRVLYTSVIVKWDYFHFWAVEQWIAIMSAKWIDFFLTLSAVILIFHKTKISKNHEHCNCKTLLATMGKNFYRSHKQNHKIAMMKLRLLNYLNIVMYVWYLKYFRGSRVWWSWSVCNHHIPYLREIVK